jgi:3-oxoacyl-(acyl-carrier-protein) synthase
MMYKIGDGIISPLGANTEDNYQAVKAGYTGIRQFQEGFRGMPFSLKAALISPRDLEALAAPYCGARTHAMSRYRQAMSAVFESAVSNTVPDQYRSEILSSRRVAFIFCTTKGDVDSYRELTDHTTRPRLYPWHVPQRMMDELKLPGKPYVVMNSSLSGLQAQIVANRLLCKGSPYDFAVVIGVELISMFTITLLKNAGLVSDNFVRPFDNSLDGTNPGESASCAIYMSEERFLKDRKNLHLPAIIKFVRGVVTCDPCYAKIPHPEGKAIQRAIATVMEEEYVRNLSFINVHGVGLRIYDDMVVNALVKSGLRKVPMNCFEGNFGHSSGSTSLMNSVLGAKSLENEEILPTLGYQKKEVPGKIHVVTDVQSSRKNSFLNISMGFGGVNAVALFTKER